MPLAQLDKGEGSSLCDEGFGLINPALFEKGGTQTCNQC